MSETKQRHGCLTALLIFMLLANSLAAVMYLFGSAFIKAAYPGISSGIVILLAVMCFFNLACTVALFKWKKWAFFGYLGSSIVALIVNLYLGMGIGQSLFGLLGIALLYGVLHIGKENKGWPQLE